MPDAAITSRVTVPPHEIHFQCMVELATETVIGYEALARFADGRSPQDHLADAAAADHLVELEIALLRSAIAAADAIPHEYAVTLNASAETIDSPAIDDLFPAGRLWGIELAETSLPESDDRLRRRTHELGVLLLIDDAGTAHATTEWVEALHPDIVKVDRSIIQAACLGGAGREELESFLVAARAIGATTVAEGVETDEHARMAQSAGIDFAQGWRYGRPAPFAA